MLISGYLYLDIVLNAINRGEVARVIRKPFEQYEFISNIEDAFRTQSHILNTLQVYKSKEKSHLLSQFRQCIQDDHFQLALQPIVKVQNIEVIGFEALLRCDQVEFKNALQIIHTAKVLGCIDEIADTVSQKALKWLTILPDNFIIFINMHPQELQSPERLAKRLESLADYSQRIVFEITELDQILSHDKFNESISILRKQVFALALDNLGSGYNSLSMLATLQPEYIKIDRSLIHDIHNDAKKQPLVQFLIGTCQKIGARIVCEGIEKLEEAQFLRECGANYMQGFMLGRPTFSPQTEVQATVASIQEKYTSL